MKTNRIQVYCDPQTLKIYDDESACVEQRRVVPRVDAESAKWVIVGEACSETTPNGPMLLDNQMVVDMLAVGLFA